VNIASWLIVGAIAGFLAEKAMKVPMGLIGNIVVGIVGGLLAGWVTTQVTDVEPMAALDITSIVVAFVGAVVLLWVAKMVKK
jgi:uncharacterized membrane protein YeaQ/YmgE (transglycosylase-associated protein family)